MLEIQPTDVAYFDKLNDLKEENEAMLEVIKFYANRYKPYNSDYDSNKDIYLDDIDQMYYHGKRAKEFLDKKKYYWMK